MPPSYFCDVIWLLLLLINQRSFVCNNGPEQPYYISLLHRGLFHLPIFPVSWGIGRGEIKCAGVGEKGNGSARWTLGREKKKASPSHRPPRVPEFLISLFPLSFPRFLAVSPLKEPLRRREIFHLKSSKWRRPGNLKAKTADIHTCNHIFGMFIVTFSPLFREIIAFIYGLNFQPFNIIFYNSGGSP